MENSRNKGLLSVEVKAPTVVAGTSTTVSLIIRNPFSEKVIIESIQAPSSTPLLPAQKSRTTNVSEDNQGRRGIWQSIETAIKSLRVHEFSVGPLTAGFPEPQGRAFHINLEPKSRLIVKNTFGPYDKVHITSAEGAEVVFDASTVATEKQKSEEERVIPPQQEDLASFELKTAHWLLVKPKILDLYALIKFRIGDEAHSQVVPVPLSVQPPVKSIVLGSVSGGTLGWLARQLNKGALPAEFELASSIVSVMGVIVMSTILAIVLSRQDATKGFVTLEDFYGAFVVGVILGYTGTEYFETSIKGVVGT